MSIQANPTLWGRVRGDDQNVVPEPVTRFGLNKLVIGGLLVCIGYFLGAKLGLALTLHPRPVSVMWPPNSILLAALLLSPVRYWGFLLLCALPAHLWVQIQGGIPVGMMLSWCVSNATEALIGAGLTRWMISGPFQLRGGINTAAFIVCGGLLGPILSSFLDAGLVRFNKFGEGSYCEILKIRIFANVLAALTVAPVIVLWAQLDFTKIWRANWKRVVEGAALGIGLVWVGYFVFLRDPIGMEDPTLIYAPLPLLLWAAVRFGATAAATAVVGTAMVSIYGTAHGSGPYATGLPEANALSLQIFLSLSAVVLLSLCAVMADLDQARDRFARAFHSSPDAMLIARKSDGRIVEWNKSAETLFGLTRSQSVGANIANLKIFPSEKEVRGLLAATSAASSDLELPVRSREGETRHTLVSAHTEEIDGASCLILSLRDLTERRRLEEEAWELNMRLLTAKEEERKRIARELHDDFSQRLALVAVEVDLLNEQAKADEESKMEQLESISFNLRELSTDVGRIANQLHPAQLERLGLVAAMQAFCEDTEQRWSVSVHFEQQGKISKELGFPEALCLYRVLQEGLQNAVKHSESREVKVELKGEEEQIRLAVSDRGKGFDAHDEAIRNGLGLVSMRERVKQVFGSFEIDSKLGQGTTIVVTVPLVPKASDGRAAYTRQAARALPLIDSGESPPRKS